MEFFTLLCKIHSETPLRISPNIAAFVEYAQGKQ